MSAGKIANECRKAGNIRITKIDNGITVKGNAEVSFRLSGLRYCKTSREIFSLRHTLGIPLCESF